MKRFHVGATLPVLALLTVVGCSTSASRDDIYWDAFDGGAKIAGDYEPPPVDAGCTDGSITDTAQRILKCSRWDKPSQDWVRQQCGEQMPNDVADRTTWMAGCTDGANDSPEYEVYGKHP
ncbi:hypothetical protein ABZS71_01370 [Streptomyces sp. NPDC005393]|uniref:hypothetical protein n=1 Tax=Streptomyces sp. NPDC005393 TaxID=3157041 RepID=UPI0033B59F9A